MNARVHASLILRPAILRPPIALPPLAPLTAQMESHHG